MLDKGAADQIKKASPALKSFKMEEEKSRESPVSDNFPEQLTHSQVSYAAP